MQIMQFVFEERNEDASKALKCFFVWSWCMHGAVCFWGKKWGCKQSTQMFLCLIMMHALCSLFLRQEMGTRGATGPESSGSASFDKNKGRWTRWRKTNSLRKEMRMQAKHSNVSSFDHEMHCAFWGKKWGREQSTQMFLRLIVAKMPDILIQASCLHLLLHRWDLPLLFLSLDLLL